MNEFEFKGGIQTRQGGGTCKFLLFLLNGQKEVSLHEAIKFNFAKRKEADSIVNWSPDIYQTDLPIAKLVMFEDAGFGKEKLSQSFWLALGKKLERQIVTIKPRLPQAVSAGYHFVGEASFMKKSEVLALLDEESVSAKVLMCQRTPAVSVLKQIINIERIGLPKTVLEASHGAVRKLRIR